MNHTDQTESADARRPFLPPREIWPALAALIILVTGVSAWVGGSWWMEHQRTALAHDHAMLIQQASATLNSRGVAHVLPTSLVEIERTLQLLRETLRENKLDGEFGEIEDLSQAELAAAAELLAVRGENDRLTLVYDQAGGAGNPQIQPGTLTPVSAAAKEQKR